MKLKQYVVIKKIGHESPAIWTKAEWETHINWTKVNSKEPLYAAITTFNAGEELKEGGGMKTKEEILRKNIDSKCDQEYAVLSAMDEYAAQFAGTDIIEQKDNEIASLKEQVSELKETLRELQKILRD